MIKGDQIALKADAQYDERRGPSAFETFVIYKPEQLRKSERSCLERSWTN